MTLGSAASRASFLRRAREKRLERSSNSTTSDSLMVLKSAGCRSKEREEKIGCHHQRKKRDERRAREQRANRRGKSHWHLLAASFSAVGNQAPQLSHILSADGRERGRLARRNAPLPEIRARCLRDGGQGRGRRSEARSESSSVDRSALFFGGRRRKKKASSSSATTHRMTSVSSP